MIYGENEQFQDTINIAFNDKVESTVEEIYVIDRVKPEECDGTGFYKFYLKTYE